MTRPVNIPIISKEPVASVSRILVLEEIGKDLFRAHSLPQVRRVYGGQVIAQALIANAATIDKPRLPHSFHTYFTCGGTPSPPFELRVERLRDGRPFPLRRIVCLQGGKEILAPQASHQGPKGGLVFTSKAPEATPPEELPSTFEIFWAIDHPVGRFLGKAIAFNMCHVQQSLYTKANESPSNRQQLWIRPRATIPQGVGQHVHRALLAYVIDQIMLEPTMRVPGLPWMTPGMFIASPDHVIWFYRDVDISEWFLLDGERTNVNSGRTLVTIRVLTRNGALLIEATQRGILRVSGYGRKGSGCWGFGIDPKTGTSQLSFA